MTDAARSKVIDVACLVIGAALLVVGRLTNDIVLTGVGPFVMGVGVPTLASLAAMVRGAQAQRDAVQAKQERDQLHGVVQEIADQVSTKVLSTVKLSRRSRETLESMARDAERKGEQ